MYTNTFVTHQWNPDPDDHHHGRDGRGGGFIVLVERGERRIPVQYAKRVVGRRMMGGQSTHLPLKVNAGGVIPIIFRLVSAGAAADGPAVSGGEKQPLAEQHVGCAGRSRTAVLRRLCRADRLLLLLLRLDHLQSERSRGQHAEVRRISFPGIRPGKNTAEYMDKILSKITVVGGLYLSILSLIPQIMIQGIKLQRLPLVGNFIDAHFPRLILDGLGVTFFFGGTSLLIVVGVAMDTVNQVEAQLIMRHYDGFTPRSGRIRGRRGTTS